MQTHVERAYPNEGCGLMLGHFQAATGEKTLVEVKPLENAWSAETAAELAERSQGLTPQPERTRTSRYWIDPQDLLRVQREARDRNLAIIGVYHSHPDQAAVPSECDRALAWSDYAYMIISVNGGRAADVQNWQLDAAHQFQPEPMKLVPASAATDRMSAAVS
ncbi:MAG: M67 family metallopeptidase [Leptolyngbya sp. SIO4C1]|nr:M67 family metallopeptidase [Leptolyngbya sp. SIO4C1]